MMFLPTLFYWSISLLKEPLYLLAGTLTLTGAIASARASALRARILPLTAMVGGLALINGLRPGGFALAALGLGCGIAILAFFSSPPRVRAYGKCCRWDRRPMETLPILRPRPLPATRC